MSNQKQLQQLKTRMENDISLPLRETATHLVFGEGNPDADLYFLGEAPGRFEDVQGRPFVGQAGKLLDKLLASIGMKREDVYISNMVRFRPPNNRPPTPAELTAFEPYVSEELEIVQPKLVVTLGRFAMEKFLPGEKISKIHGELRPVEWHGKTIKLFPLYHPSAALRSSSTRQALEEDFKKIPGVLAKI
ncbi:MAG TPA: uracil-DNA glycosylase [Ktedonobacteraceae bacterium]